MQEGVRSSGFVMYKGESVFGLKIKGCPVFCQSSDKLCPLVVHVVLQDPRT